MGLRLPSGQLPQGALPLLLAAVGFLCASVGSALLSLGHHIFDQVKISERWRPKLPVGDEGGRSGATRCDAPDGNGHSSYFIINQDNRPAFDSSPSGL